MANRVIIVQTLFLAWAILGCVGSLRAETTAEDIAEALKIQQSSLVPSRRQLSEPTQRENLGICIIPCFGLLPVCCFGFCVDIQFNPLHCGGCGIFCPLGTVCCSESCVNLLTDPANCGFCGNKCGLGFRCLQGFCNYNGRI